MDKYNLLYSYSENLCGNKKYDWYIQEIRRSSTVILGLRSQTHMKEDVSIRNEA